MKLLMIRHGLPVRTENEGGAPADPPLSDEAREQAAKLANWLSKETIHAVYSSPMRRAVETAAPLATLLGVEVLLEPGVVELDFESETYIPLEELKVSDPERWRAQTTDYFGTDLEAFASTVERSIEGIIANHPGENIAIFCHGGVINVWSCKVLGKRVALFLDSGYTSVSRFLAASSGERSVESLNETGHLRSS